MSQSARKSSVSGALRNRVKDVSFGQIYPVDSPIHRMDARAKLLITIAYIVMMFFVNHYVVYGVIALCLVAVVLMSRVPPLKVLRSVRAIIFLLIFTFIITVLDRKSTRLNSSHSRASRMPSSA